RKIMLYIIIRPVHFTSTRLADKIKLFKFQLILNNKSKQAEIKPRSKNSGDFFIILLLLNHIPLPEQFSHQQNHLYGDKAEIASLTPAKRLHYQLRVSQIPFCRSK